MKRISNAKFAQYRNILQDSLEKDTGLKDIKWYKHVDVPLAFGEDSGDMGGSFYISHTEQSLASLIPESLELVKLTRYTEMDENDSCWIVLQKRNKK